VVEAYVDATGHAVEAIRFYKTFGVFKVAVIAQQIYTRHVAGQTTDARFAMLGGVVQALGDRAIVTCGHGSS
jgi:aminoglycoside phosphotransferase (APT) family kinase protein